MEGGDGMNDLTPIMRRALAEIVRRPGNFPHAYPGGAKTTNALLRRDLIRAQDVNTAGVTTNVLFPTPYGFRIAHLPTNGRVAS